MTDIAFAEITESTKPRPNAPEDENPACTGDYVKASSVLVPELELLIFACRELSDYISEGKSTLQKFEEEIDTNNPPLIGQYLHETPGVQEFMKSQLVTTRQYAQLKAKEGWYDWRDKLIAQLNGVLRINLEQLKKDHKSVGDFSQRVATLLPELQAIRDQLEKTVKSEREEYNAMIQKEENLMKSLQSDISDTTAKFNDTVTGIYKLEQDKKKMQEQLALLKQEKEQLQKEISESQQICEESKFLTSSDLVQLKERYEWLSTLHGWKIAKLLHSTILMTYKDMLQFKIFPLS
ncbi:Spc7 kinetochore protein domain-containing protein [Paraphysoderma sedebokerense]|nr:Spc7 kinetochore protein domain-containing protein [Paraphysoderma sedebokerense]